MTRLWPLIVLWSVAGLADQPVSLIPFSSPESAARLERSIHKVDFFPLANHFESQLNAGFCGPASAVVVLNALRAGAPHADLPVDRSTVPPEFLEGLPPGREPFFRRYTQRTFFDAQTDRVKPLAVVFGRPTGKDGRRDPGLQLRQLQQMLETKGLRASTHVVTDPAKTGEQRKLLVQNLRTSGDYVIVNYFRPALGQQGGGHISPLGAFDEQTNSFLVMDVNPNGKTWVWVPSSALFAAMGTRDTIENRGFLLVKDLP